MIPILAYTHMCKEAIEDFPIDGPSRRPRRKREFSSWPSRSDSQIVDTTNILFGVKIIIVMGICHKGIGAVWENTLLECALSSWPHIPLFYMPMLMIFGVGEHAVGSGGEF
jgi:hypothetical protein